MVGFDQPRLEQLLARSRRPRLGAAVADAEEMAVAGRSAIRQGAFVGRVTTGSVAQKAGLQVGDVIQTFAGHDISSAVTLERLLARVQPGQRIPVAYVRGTDRRSAVLEF
ncbi:MAG: PDZ domain-containing protein [Anaerolineae bacterium]